jgi:hypothetical protein
MRSISAFEQTLVAGGDYSPDAFSDGFAGNGWDGGGVQGYGQTTGYPFVDSLLCKFGVNDYCPLPTGTDTIGVRG